MSVDIEPSEVVFFLGAGASIPAGVPDTKKFVEEFEKYAQGNLAEEEFKTISDIIKILQEWKKEEGVDIELLLETLIKLENKEDEPMLQFYEGGNFKLSAYPGEKPLIEALKDFIKKRAIVSSDKIKYLNPLLTFDRPIDIISVNYDTSIEQFCNEYRLVYQDGFDIYWNPEKFKEEHTDIRLYKLHGSVTWYRSDRGTYIKLPIKEEGSKITLITGEKAETLMLYPMQKWEYAEPLMELLLIVKSLLESEKCKFLVVVGYSFRDEHIKKILWDCARKNRELTMILIDPNAYKICSEKLKYYDPAQKIPSSLSGRVVCLSYRFEEVLPLLKNYYLYNLFEGIKLEKDANQKESEGHKVDFIPCIEKYLEAEHEEKAILMLNKWTKQNLAKKWAQTIYEIEDNFNNTYIDLINRLRIDFRFLIYWDINKYDQFSESLAEEYRGIFIDDLKKVMVKGIKTEFIERYNEIQILFLESTPLKLLENFQELFKFFQIRFQMITDGNFSKISTITLWLNDIIRDIKKYLKELKNGRINFKKYIELREAYGINMNNVMQIYNEYCENKTEERQKKLEASIAEVEQEIIEKIIKI